MKQGDNVLIWGASGGLGSYATQFALHGGATPSAWSPARRRRRSAGPWAPRLVIDRAAEGYRFWQDEHTQDPREWKRFGKRIRELTGGEDPDIVFEHPGRETFGAQCLRHAQGRHDRDVRVDVRVHARVRQPVSVDVAQAHHRLALRQLPRGVGGQPAPRQGQDPPHALQVVPAGGDRAGGATRCTATCTRARSASCAWHRRKDSASATPGCARSTTMPSTASAHPGVEGRHAPASRIARRGPPDPARCGRPATAACARLTGPAPPVRRFRRTSRVRPAAR